MARLLKRGIPYFPIDVDIFEDDKIFDLSNEYGPLGEVIYIRILCLIYKNGYYYKFDSLDKLASLLIKSIGNRWVRDKQAVLQVIPFLAKCNLLSLELMQENVLTSVRIQKQYLKATERRQPMNNLEYWIIDENGNSLQNVHKNGINVYRNEINVCNNEENVCNGTQSKVKKSKVKESKVVVEENTAAADTPIEATNCFKYYQSKIGLPSPNCIETIKSYLDDGVAEDVVIKAIDEALNANVRNWNYISKVLVNWFAANVKTLDDLARYKADRQQRTTTKQQQSATGNPFFDLLREEGKL